MFRKRVDRETTAHVISSYPIHLSIHPTMPSMQPVSCKSFRVAFHKPLENPYSSPKDFSFY